MMMMMMQMLEIRRGIRPDQTFLFVVDVAVLRWCSRILHDGAAGGSALVNFDDSVSVTAVERRVPEDARSLGSSCVARA